MKEKARNEIIDTTLHAKIVNANAKRKLRECNRRMNIEKIHTKIT